MRPLGTALQTAMVDPVVRGVYLVALYFDEGIVAWNSGGVDIDHNGLTYTAVGDLGNVSSLSEEPGVKASRVTLTVSGINPEITTTLMATQWMGRRVTIHFALLDESYRFDPDTCLQVFSGSIDGISGNQGQTASYDISVASRLSDWERTRKLLYNDADQQRLHPGDRGMEYIAQLSTKKIIWPRAQFLPKQ